VKRSLVLVAVVAIACSRHPLEREDGGDAGAGGDGIAGAAGRGAAGVGDGGSAVAGSGGVGGVAGGGGAAGGIGGTASGGIGGTASGGASGIGGTANGGASGIGGTSASGIGGAANGGSGGVASGGAGAAGAGGMAGSAAGCNGAAGAVGACKLQVGQPCVLNAECATAVCADGVCCESACVGACVSCNQAASLGRCMAVAPGGPDPHASCVATSPASCGFDGRCDGSGACRKHVVGTLCEAATCSGDVFTPPSVCNGAGTCVRPLPISCAPYRCGPQSCISFCTADLQCSFGVCRDGLCRPPGGAPCLDNNECASGFCVQGVCCATACQGPCRSCALAGTAGVCMPVPNPDRSWNCPSGS
jgi:hypothetical protein